MHLLSVRNLTLGVAAMLMMGLATAMVPTPALAQDAGVVKSDEFGVEIPKPAGWEEAKSNEKAVAVFTDPKTQSHIEVLPTKLMSEEVAEVFFNTFHKTLTESTFKKSGEETTVELYGDKNAKETTYEFTHSGITLRIHVVSFMRKGTAWLVVGYIQSKEDGNVKAQFDAVAKKLVFKE